MEGLGLSYPRTGICELAVGREDALNWILSRSRVRSHEALDLVRGGGADARRRRGIQQLSVMEFANNLNPASSYFTKAEHRIYLRCAACWEIASQRGHCKQKQRHDQKHNRIMGANTIEQTCHHGRSECRKDHSGNDAHAGKRDPLP